MATMTELYHLSINLHGNKNDNITVDDCFNELLKATCIVHNLTNEEQQWYLTGYSKSEASKYFVFDKNKPSIYAYNNYQKSYKKNNFLINKSIWNNKEDGMVCAISHHMMFIDNLKSFDLVINMHQKPKDIKTLIKSVAIISKDKENTWITVDSKGYRLHGRNVFPDRMSVGWILYLPHIILPELVPEAARVIPVLDEGKQRGTIIVTTEEFFDGAKKEHIEKANDIEIRLLDLGMLPLMTEL